MKNKLPHIFLLIGSALIIALTFSLSLTRHYGLKSSGIDGMLIEQTLFNFLNGNGLVTSIHSESGEQHWLGIHFSPILYLIAPIYYLFPHLETLLFIHSFFIIAATIPLFFAARLILKSEWLAFIASLLYLINPFTINAAISDFHEIAFAPFLISLMLWAILAGKKTWLVLFCVILLTVKEHYGLAVFGTGLLWAWHWRDVKFGLSLAAFGLLAFFVVLKIIMPYFSPLGAAAMLSENSDIDRFSWLMHPLQDTTLLGKILSGGFFYGVLLLFPFLAQPILSFAWLLPAMADGAVNLLAREDMMRHPVSYHSVAIIPVLLIAYCKTISRKYSEQTNLKPREMLGVTALVAVVFSYCFAALPYLPNDMWELENVTLSLAEKNKHALSKINEITGNDTTISAQNNLLSLIPVHRAMYVFPSNLVNAEYILISSSLPFEHRSNMFGIPYFERNTDKYFTAVNALLGGKDFGVVFYQDNWLLLKRGAQSNESLATAAKADMEKLKEKVEELDKRKIVIQPSHQP